jgi:hypothetical protein
VICDCSEAHVGYRRLAASPHNCDYIKRRNALIPKAERIATPRGGYGWGADFLEAMNWLAREARVSGLL